MASSCGAYDSAFQSCIDGIRMSVWCADCCCEVLRKGNHAIVGRKHDYKNYCVFGDLQGFDLKTPIHTKRGHHPRLFFLAETKCYGEVRKTMYAREREQNGLAPSILNKRRQILLRSLGLTPAEFVSEDKRVAMIFLLQDYLKEWKPATKLEDVWERWQVFPRVQEILDNCPGARPDAAFDFCLRYHRAGAAEFLHAKSSAQQVFYLFGNKIMGYLKDDSKSFDMRCLLDTPLEDEYMRFGCASTRRLQLHSPEGRNVPTVDTSVSRAVDDILRQALALLPRAYPTPPPPRAQARQPQSRNNRRRRELQRQKQRQRQAQSKPRWQHGGHPGWQHGGHPGWQHGGHPGWQHGGHPGWQHGGHPGWQHGGHPGWQHGEEFMWQHGEEFMWQHGEEFMWQHGEEFMWQHGEEEEFMWQHGEEEEFMWQHGEEEEWQHGGHPTEKSSWWQHGGHPRWQHGGHPRWQNRGHPRWRGKPRWQNRGHPRWQNRRGKPRWQNGRGKR